MKKLIFIFLAILSFNTYSQNNPDKFKNGVDTPLVRVLESFTNTELDALTDKEEGDKRYSSTDSEWKVYDGTNWVSFGSGGGSITFGTTAGTAAEGNDSRIVANTAKVSFPGFDSLFGDYGFNLTTNGTSGASTFDGTTLNIPQYSGSMQNLDQVLAQGATATDKSIFITGSSSFGLNNGIYDYLIDDGFIVSNPEGTGEVYTVIKNDLYAFYNNTFTASIKAPTLTKSFNLVLPTPATSTDTLALRSDISNNSFDPTQSYSWTAAQTFSGDILADMIDVQGGKVTGLGAATDPTDAVSLSRLNAVAATIPQSGTDFDPVGTDNSTPQNASQVPATAVNGNTNVQTILENHETRMDVLEAGSVNKNPRIITYSASMSIAHDATQTDSYVEATNSNAFSFEVTGTVSGDFGTLVFYNASTYGAITLLGGTSLGNHTYPTTGIITINYYHTPQGLFFYCANPESSGGGSSIDYSFNDVTGSISSNQVNHTYDANRPNIKVDVTSFLTFNMNSTSNGARGYVDFIRGVGGETANIFVNGTSPDNRFYQEGDGNVVRLKYVNNGDGIVWTNENPPMYIEGTGSALKLDGNRYYNFTSPLVNTYNYSINPSNIVPGSTTEVVVYANAEITLRSSNNTTAGNFIIGRQYRIESAGTTDFTLIGAADNNFGTLFIATGVGTGTGQAKEQYKKLSGTWVNNTNMLVTIKAYPNNEVRYELTQY